MLFSHRIIEFTTVVLSSCATTQLILFKTEISSNLREIGFNERHEI